MKEFTATVSIKKTVVEETWVLFEAESLEAARAELQAAKESGDGSLSFAMDSDVQGMYETGSEEIVSFGSLEQEPELCEGCGDPAPCGCDSRA